MIKKLSLICLLVLAACSQKTEEKPPYLFVVVSKHGELSQAANGSWELVLDQTDVEKVLAFPDGTRRKVRYMDPGVFKRMWGEGPNSFTDDPPNATVIIGQHIQAVVLLNVRVEGTKTIFQVRADGPQKLSQVAGYSQLFIDGHWIARRILKSAAPTTTACLLAPDGCTPTSDGNPTTGA